MKAVLNIQHPDGRREERTLPTGIYKVGREDADIVLADPNVSAVHAQLTVAPGEVLLTDAGSSNGTFDASGQRLSGPHALQLGQAIRMGATSLTLQSPPAATGAGATLVMDPSTVAPVRGTIIKVPDSTPGLLIVAGKQHSFVLEHMWQSAIAPAPNMPVAVSFDRSGAIASVAAIDPQLIAKERLQQLGSSAQEHGLQAATVASQGLAALAARMGKVELVSTAVVWLAWFVLPVASITMIATKSFTFWDVLGVDVSNPLNDLGSHGLVSWLGVACIAAPFAVPYLRHPRARLLNVAPLGFVLLYVGVLWSRLHSASADAQSLAGGQAEMGQIASAVQQSMVAGLLDAFSLGAGFFVLPLATLVLATRAFVGAGSGVSASGSARSIARPLIGGKAVKLALVGALVAGGGYLAWQRFGAELSASSLAKKIDQKLAAEGKVCWKLQDMNVQFPVHVRQGFGATLNEDPILQGLARSGYISLAQAGGGMFGYANAVTIDLTDKGRQAQVWVPQHGFCVGTQQVHEVVRWSEPSARTGALATVISYTWVLGDRPAWADEKAFGSVPGVAKPVAGTALASKMNDGWQIVSAM